MASASILIRFHEGFEPLKLPLAVGQAVEIPLVNRSSKPVRYTVAVKLSRGFRQSILAVEVNGETRYLGRSTPQASFSLDLEPGASAKLSVRFIAPRSESEAEAELEVSVKSLAVVSALAR
ncbi:MAG: hypothetical protein QXU91_03400 [Thermofilum sp.]